MPGEEMILSSLMGSGGGGGNSNVVASGVNSLVGIAKIASGIIGGARTNKALKNLKRPDYQIQQPLLDNQALAQARAAQGLSDAARTVYADNLSQGTAQTLDAILKGGGDVNNVSDLLDNHVDGAARIAALEDEMRLKNQQGLLNQNAVLADAQEKQWMVNQWEPHRNQLQELTRRKQDYGSRVWQGVDQIAAGAQRAAMQQLYQGDGRTPTGGSDYAFTPNAFSGTPPVGLYGEGSGSFMDATGKFADPAKRNYYAEVAKDFVRRGLIQ